MMSSNVLLSQVDKTTIISFLFGGIQINRKTLLNENHRPSKKFSNLISGMGREISLFELKWQEREKKGKKMDKSECSQRIPMGEVNENEKRTDRQRMEPRLKERERKKGKRNTTNKL